MSRRIRKPDRRFPGPTRLVVALLAMEAVAVVALPLVGVAWSSIALMVAPISGLTIALLSPTIQELGRPQARLSIAAEQETGNGTVPAPALCPWPVDADRVMANELADARETLVGGQRLSDMSLGMGGLFTRPSEAAHAEARESFDLALADFETQLRAWLKEYSGAALTHSRTLDLTIRLSSAGSGAHAEGVRVVLELPATVSVADERPVVPLPPERPEYEPPRPQFAGGWINRAVVSPVAWQSHFPGVIPEISVQPPSWKLDGSCVEASIGDVHAGRSVGVGEPLLLLVDGPGDHEVRWTTYTRSARRPARGTLTLTVPAATDRPAMGRLHGLTSYPDVPIVDSEGEIVHPVRTTDPPPRSPVGPEGGDIKARLRHRAASWDWHSLGLDPAADNPHRSSAESETS